MTTLPTSLSNLNITTFNKIYPLLVQKYSTLIPDPNANTLDKINSIIDSLNHVGKVGNDVIDNWNKVMAWVMNDGLNTDVTNKINSMVADGTFDAIFQKDIVPSLGNLSDLTTTDKSNVVHAVNEVNGIAKTNQTNVGTLSNLQTTHKTDLVSAVNDNASQLSSHTTQLQNIRNSILNWGGSDDGVTANDTAWGNAKYNSRKGNGTTDQQSVYFPNNVNGNAVYYFNSTPNLDYVYIYADKGVKLSFPSTNGWSAKNAIFVNDIQIISRDRNNTGVQLTDFYSPILFTGLTENPVDIGMKKPRWMSFSEFTATAYHTDNNTPTATTFGVFDSTRNIYKSTDGSATNNGQLNTLELPFTAGHLYTCLMLGASGPETNTSVRFGVTFSQDGGNFLYYSSDINGYFYKGIRQGSAWNETTNPNMSKSNGQLTDAYLIKRPILMGIRPINANTVEIYVNGVLIDTVSVSFNATKIGFAMNHVNSVNSGINNIVFGSWTDEYIKKANRGKDLNIVGFGDSISFGEGASISWVDFLPKFLAGQRGINSISVNNQAVSGQNSTQQLSVMNSFNFSGYDLTLILIGTNDIQGGTSASTFQSNLQAMVNKAGMPCVIGIPPMFITNTLTGVGFQDSNYDYGAEIRAMVMQVVANNNNVYLADTLSEIGLINANNATTVLRDNLHPSSFGQLMLSRCFARSVIRALSNDM